MSFSCRKVYKIILLFITYISSCWATNILLCHLGHHRLRNITVAWRNNDRWLRNLFRANLSFDSSFNYILILPLFLKLRWKIFVAIFLTIFDNIMIFENFEFIIWIKLLSPNKMHYNIFIIVPTFQEIPNRRFWLCQIWPVDIACEEIKNGSKRKHSKNKRLLKSHFHFFCFYRRNWGLNFSFEVLTFQILTTIIYILIRFTTFQIDWKFVS